MDPLLHLPFFDHIDLLHRYLLLPTKYKDNNNFQ
jgi:hypothetical protein